MFFDDLKLVEEAVAKHGPVEPLFVEVGGLEDPAIADYSITIAAVNALQTAHRTLGARITDDDISRAQHARYRRVHRPLDAAIPGYVCEDPGTGGCTLRDLQQKYDRTIGCLVMLSTLEHVDEPWYADEDCHWAMKPGGLLIVSVPFLFPHHPSPRDFWRFSPDGLRKIFEGEFFDVLECDWRLRIPADAGVLDIHTGRPQAIESCALIARAK